MNMEDRLRAYMDEIFAGVKVTRKSVELKEEVLQNITDKYHDLLEEGKSPEAAYNIAVASIGDIQELLDVLEEDGDGFGKRENSTWTEKHKKRYAGLTALAVVLYILCLMPVILFEDTPLEDSLGIGIMFLMIAVATGILIYVNMTKPSYKRKEESMVEDFKEWQSQTEADRRARKAINSCLWALAVLCYILVSFTSGAWHITWVIFLLAAAVEEIIKAIFELRKR